MLSLPQITDWKQGDELDLNRISNCYCPNCHESVANTILLPTKIPMFKEIIVMSLHCEKCSFRDSSVTFGGEIQPQGETITLNMRRVSDLDRFVVKAESATIMVPELELEIPPSTQKGSVCTIEGILQRIVGDLDRQQGDRLRSCDFDNFYRCRNVIEKIQRVLNRSTCMPQEARLEDEKMDPIFRKSQCLTFIINDPAGNSYLENPFAPNIDPHMHKSYYDRTSEEDLALGLHSFLLEGGGEYESEGPLCQHDRDEKNSLESKHQMRNAVDLTCADNIGNQDIGRQEPIVFPSTCAACYADAKTTMCLTKIPLFNEVCPCSLRFKWILKSEILLIVKSGLY